MVLQRPAIASTVRELWTNGISELPVANSSEIFHLWLKTLPADFTNDAAALVELAGSDVWNCPPRFAPFGL